MYRSAIKPSTVQRWINRWRPSSKLRTDPLNQHVVEGRYRPVTIASLKLIPPAAQHILTHRIAQPLTFSREQRLTVVIPIRNREAHLRELLPRLREVLDAQGIAYRLLAVEQDEHGLFNKGKLLNIGMQWAAKDSDYFCLHDVDMIPLDANYLAPSQPLRLVNELVTTWRGASTFSPHYFAGVITLLKEQVFAANGFSNEYWGWGKEDDDFYFRMLLAGWLCYFDTQGRYHDLPNPEEQRVQQTLVRPPHYLRANRIRKSLLLRGLSDPAEDGLSTLRYQLLAEVEHEGYVRIRVHL